MNMTARLKESYEWGCRIFRLDIREAIAGEIQKNDKFWQALARIKVTLRKGNVQRLDRARMNMTENLKDNQRKWTHEIKETLKNNISEEIGYLD